MATSFSPAVGAMPIPFFAAVQRVGLGQRVRFDAP
jgi:hypothetical protein